MPTSTEASAQIAAPKAVYNGFRHYWATVFQRTELWIPVLIAVAGIAALAGLQQIDANSAWVRHTYEVKLAAQSALGNLRDAETSQRGFLLTGRDEYLAPFDNAISALDSGVQQLLARVADNPRQTANVRALQMVIGEKRRELSATIRLARQGEREAALALMNEDTGKKAMDAARDAFASINSVEEQLLSERSAARTLYLSFSTAMMAVSLLLALTLATTSRRRMQAANERLEETVRMRTADLSSANERLTLAEHAGRSFVYEVDVVLGTVWRSDGIETVAGWRKDQVAATLDGWRELLHPEDHAHVGPEGVADILDERDGYSIEQRVRRPDGSYVWVWDRGRVVRDADGNVARMIGSKTDIAERKRYQEQQRLLTQELAHRVKNSFAVLQSMMRATLRTTADPKKFAEAFSGRLTTLALAQDILTQSQWSGAELHALVRVQLAPFQTSDADRIAISGPSVKLPVDLAVPLGLTLHELATNASKYGALSVPTGRVGLNWTVEPSGVGVSRLRILWQESGGPAVSRPTRQGFGTTLIERGLPGASVQRDFAPAGVRCVIEMTVKLVA